MPARKRRRRIRKRRFEFKLGKKLFVLLGLIVGASIIYSIFVFKLQDHVWDTNERLSMVVDSQEEGVYVVVIDPNHEELVMIMIPENTELESARNLGTWKIGSLWQLGKNEKIGGKLLAETVTRSLKMPVYAWADEDMLNILNKNSLKIVSSILMDSDSNLTLKDKINVALFTYRLDSSRKNLIDLSQTRYISESKLTDGVLGYKIDGELNLRLISYFADEYLSGKAVRVVIYDSSNKPFLAKRMGEVVEVIGAKISSIRSHTHEVSDCEVASKDAEIAERIAKYFGCTTNQSTSSNFDAEIRIGEEFSERY